MIQKTTSTTPRTGLLRRTFIPTTVWKTCQRCTRGTQRSVPLVYAGGFVSPRRHRVHDSPALPDGRRRRRWQECLGLQIPASTSHVLGGGGIERERAVNFALATWNPVLRFCWYIPAPYDLSSEVDIATGLARAWTTQRRVARAKEHPACCLFQEWSSASRSSA